MNGRILRISGAILSALLGGASAVVPAIFLYKYEYFSSFKEIDNLIGMMPVALWLIMAAGFIAASVLAMKRGPVALVSACLAFSLISVALFPKAVTCNWFRMEKELNVAGDSPDISVYEPFKEGNSTVVLGEDAALRISEDFPVLDGALALYPVYAAVAQAVYEECEEAKNAVAFTNTIRAYKGLADGANDVILATAPSESLREYARERGVNYVLTPIGKEAFVFLVGKNNPTENLTYQQIKNIYSGKTAKWGTLGWREGGDIIAYQRPDGSGSQVGLEIIMKDMPIASPRPLSEELIGTNSLMKQVSVTYRGVQPALGYSYKFFATEMYPNENAKMLKINGVSPTADNISSGKYPFVIQFYAVTAGEPQGNTAELIEWLLSPQGQTLIEKCGYARI